MQWEMFQGDLFWYFGNLSSIMTLDCPDLLLTLGVSYILLSLHTWNTYEEWLKSLSSFQRREHWEDTSFPVVSSRGRAEEQALISFVWWQRYNHGNDRAAIREGQAGYQERFFPESVVRHWSTVPKTVIMALSLLEFRKHLDNTLRHLVWFFWVILCWVRSWDILLCICTYVCIWLEVSAVLKLLMQSGLEILSSQMLFCCNHDGSTQFQPLPAWITMELDQPMPFFSVGQNWEHYNKYCCYLLKHEVSF